MHEFNACCVLLFGVFGLFLGYCRNYGFVLEGVYYFSICHFEFQWLRTVMMVGEVVLGVGNQGLDLSVVGYRVIGQALKWAVDKN